LTHFKIIAFLLCWFVLGSNSYAQEKAPGSDCEQPATIILFRSFSLLHSFFSYNLYSGDSLLGRIKAKDVVVLQTFDKGVSFHATTKAPSLNADKRTNYQKLKTIKYPFSLQQGQVYFVKCGFLDQRLFEYPRQPTIRLLKKDEAGEYLKKRFLERKIKSYLYDEWLAEKNL